MQPSHIGIVEIGLILLAVGAIIVSSIMLNFFRKKALRRQIALTDQQQKLQYQYFSERVAQDNQLKQILEGSLDRWRWMLELVERDDRLALRAEIAGLCKDFSSMPRMVFCENAIVNAVIVQRTEQLRQQGIVWDCQLRIPEQLTIQDIDLMCLFANLLDNAIEACSNLPKSQPRWICLVAEWRCGLLLVQCSNSAQDGSAFVSQKSFHKQHGWGLRIIREIVARNNGVFRIEQPEKAQVRIVLSLMPIGMQESVAI